ncbi:MAG: VanZ family protein [Clostridia bacterium]|nr:VanZ family protein [Clostridia bacterium]
MNNKCKWLKYILLIMYLGLGLVLVVEASLPAEVSSGHSGAVSEVVQEVTESVGADKLAESIKNNLSEFNHFIRKGIGHFGAFFVLAVVGTLTFGLFNRVKSSSAVISLLTGVGFAILTEAIQVSVPGRYGCFDDVLLDSLGYIIGFVVISIIYLIFSLVKRKRITS